MAQTTGLRYAKLIGYLAVQKSDQALGDVQISTLPPTTLVDNKPKVLATGMLEVEQVINKTNVERLLNIGVITLVF